MTDWQRADTKEGKKANFPLQFFAPNPLACAGMPSPGDFSICQLVKFPSLCVSFGPFAADTAYLVTSQQNPVLRSRFQTWDLELTLVSARALSSSQKSDTHWVHYTSPSGGPSWSCKAPARRNITELQCGAVKLGILFFFLSAHLGFGGASIRIRIVPFVFFGLFWLCSLSPRLSYFFLRRHASFAPPYVPDHPSTSVVSGEEALVDVRASKSYLKRGIRKINCEAKASPTPSLSATSPPSGP